MRFELIFKILFLNLQNLLSVLTNTLVVEDGCNGAKWKQSVIIIFRQLQEMAKKLSSSD